MLNPFELKIFFKSSLMLLDAVVVLFGAGGGAIRTGSMIKLLLNPTGGAAGFGVSFGGGAAGADLAGTLIGFEIP